MAELNALEAGPIWHSKQVDLQEYLAGLDSCSISHIYMDPVVLTGTNKWIFVSEEAPVVYGENVLLGEFLALNEQFVNRNPEEVQRAVVLICSKVNTSYFALTEEFINKDVIFALSQNPYISRLRLGADKGSYVLTPEDYEVLRNSNIKTIETYRVAPELEEVYGEKIDQNNKRELINGLTYARLLEENDFTFKKPLTDKEIYNLKYVNEGIEVKFEKFGDYENIFKVITRLEELGKKGKYEIIAQEKGVFDCKNKLSEYVFQHPDVLDYDITVGIGINDKYPIKTYIEHEKRLYDLIRPAMDMSPLEKYLYAYNIVKKYKEYKENEEEKSKSRTLYEIMDGEYMVCVGFANLLKDLLGKLGIECSDYSVGVDVGFDNVPADAEYIDEEVVVKREGHARLEVHIVDPKYGVDGIYIADPTWDNDMENDYYNYALMSQDEYVRTDRANFLEPSEIKELFFVHSIEEFYQKVNFWLDKKYNREFEREMRTVTTRSVKEFQEQLTEFLKLLKPIDENSYNYFNTVYGNLQRMKHPANNIEEFLSKAEKVANDSENKELISCFKVLKQKKNDIVYHLTYANNTKNSNELELMKNLLDTLKFLDRAKYEELAAKYGEIAKFSFEPDEKYLQEFITEFGEYIVSKVNKPIDGKIIFKAIKAVYEKIAGTEVTKEQQEEQLDQLLQKNNTRQKKVFPKRDKILPDGTREEYYPEDDKFDFEIKSMFR